MAKIIICCEREATERLWREMLRGTPASHGVVIVNTLPRLASAFDLHNESLKLALLSWRLDKNTNCGLVASEMLDAGIEVIGVTTIHHTDFSGVGVTQIMEDANRVTELLKQGNAIRKYLAGEIFLDDLVAAALK